MRVANLIMEGGWAGIQQEKEGDKAQQERSAAELSSKRRWAWQ
jgi:hypothetical protein